MVRIKRLDLFAIDLPFRKPFKHAAAARATSTSLLLRCETDSGAVGYGETLPRPYVTGETRDESFELLRDVILPRVAELEFSSLDEVKAFLRECDGEPPLAWGPFERPPTAAWCAAGPSRVTRESTCPTPSSTSTGSTR